MPRALILRLRFSLPRPNTVRAFSTPISSASWAAVTPTLALVAAMVRTAGFLVARKMAPMLTLSLPETGSTITVDR